MTFDQFSQYFAWAIYFIIFCVVAFNAVRKPVQANIDIALFFAAPALIIGISLVGTLGLVPTNPVMNAISTSLLIAMGYMLFRLVDDFSIVPAWLRFSVPALLVLFVLINILVAPRYPAWFTSLEVLYIVGLLVYAAVGFIRESRHSSGVTKRRMVAVALGSILLSGLFVLVGIFTFFPSAGRSLGWVVDLTQVGSGLLYFLGFATPSILRRAWQEPELRAFLGRAASLPRLPDTAAIIEELEAGAKSALGASGASIGLWDEKVQRLRFKTDGGDFDADPHLLLGGRPFLTQQPLFSSNTMRDNPGTAQIAQERGIVALLSAPITAGEKKLGVLTVFAQRSPIFAEEDLALVQLLADQAAVILESRALIDEAAHVRAREEVARLKEDFLSAAAHDLKTPLTTLIMQTELLERRALRDPGAPADLASLQKLKKEANRLKTLVLELLDAARAEQGRLVGERTQVDLVALAQDVCSARSTDRHPCSVEAGGPVPGPVVGVYDPNRILQLLENLVENAIKYSPDGGPVDIKVWSEKDTNLTGSGDGGANGAGGELNHIIITDTGIGIPKEDLPNVFERFHRGSNVDDRHFAGMGLGLFICKGIVEQHGGRISVESPAAGQHPSTGGDKGHDASARYSAGGSTNGRHDTGDEQSSISGHNTGSHIAGSTGASANPGTTFHVVLPGMPAALPSQPGTVGSIATQPQR